jgi:2'-5' RNA ligase
MQASRWRLVLPILLLPARFQSLLCLPSILCHPKSLSMIRHLQSSDASETTPTQPPPPQKFHHFTICLVPPEVTQDDRLVWESLTHARTKLRDPGLYRWPPHANLLYPFVDPYVPKGQQNDGASTTGVAQLQSKVLDRLQEACQSVPPFEVRLERLGTFGGAKRGVLWLYPDSFRCGETVSEDVTTEPLLRLQAALQDTFPHCDDQQKFGTFQPHVTLSHFVNLAAAREAQAQIEQSWEAKIFTVKEIYLLHRQGDAGQFRRVATIGLGEQCSGWKSHCPPLPFCHMPTEEADWVLEERMKLKQRRNRKGGSRRGDRRRQQRRTSPSVPDSPELVAQKRAERKAKREANEIARALASKEKATEGDGPG